MKIGHFVSTMEDLLAVPEDADDKQTPLQRIEGIENPQTAPDAVDPSGVKVAEYEFPEELVPDELNLDLLKQTNESLMTNGDLAAEKIDSLKDSIDIVRESQEVSPMTAHIIGIQLDDVTSVFPETKAEQTRWLEKRLTSDSPLIVEATVESLMQGMESLRPIVTRTLQVASNIASFLEKSEDIHLFDDRLNSAKMALRRTDRNENIKDKEEASTDFHQERYRDLYPKIVKAVQAGYTSSEVPSVIGTDNDDDKIPETAIIAISRGVEKLPLSRNRAMTGTDLGSLHEFIKKTTEFQDDAIVVLGQLLQQVTSQGGDQLNAMNLSTAADGIIAKILQNRGEDGKTVFRTYADGPEVQFTAQAKSIVPVTDGATNYGWVEPGELSDMVMAIQEKVSPALKNLKTKAAAFGQLASNMEGKIGELFTDRVQMAEAHGVELTSAFNKLTNSLKFINDMVTVSVETTLNLVVGISDIARGVAVIVES